MAEDYRPEDFSKSEVEMVKKFNLQLDDAKNYFVALIRPRLDRAYKIYICDTRDRAKEIESWQSNVFTPYAFAVVETLKPRILDARPDLGVQGRTEDDQPKATKVQYVVEYDWEKSKADIMAEMVVDASLIYGQGYLQTYWKKDTRTNEFLEGVDINSKKMTWKKKKQVFYDGPYAEHVDNYDLWYDWHNIAGEDKQYWFRRKILNKATIERRYPMCDKKRLEMACAKKGGDLTNYASIRSEVKSVQDKITKGTLSSSAGSSNIYENAGNNPELQMYEVFEWWRPFEDKYAVMVNGVPILRGAEIPNPYDFKEAPFIGIPYLKLPNEYEGYGIPLILENPSIMLNMVKNQRLDAATLNIHKMWIVNPLANINKEELVTRPFGIVYSTDPNGVRPVEFSDIKASAYKEEEGLKADMRYAIGVDDASMAVGGGSSSATETRHLRESTLERVRLYVNHLGDGFSVLLRYWISMRRQFFTKKFNIRILGDNGSIEFPLIEKDDLMGEFDFKATVLPSISGQNDVKKKQDMDLFQLLISLPFIDPQKLTSKVLADWNWDINSLTLDEQPQPQEGVPLPGAEQGVSPTGEPLPQTTPMVGNSGLPTKLGGGQIPEDVAQRALALLGESATGPSQFAEAGAPINLLKAGSPPPTAKGVPLPTTNPRGMNRGTGSKVNTNIAQKPGNGPEAQLMNRAANIQK
jgi:hypothetical protein